jgi:tRNA A37 threonylcarbamoyltransferase TsaD
MRPALAYSSKLDDFLAKAMSSTSFRELYMQREIHHTDNAAVIAAVASNNMTSSVELLNITAVDKAKSDMNMEPYRARIEFFLNISPPSFQSI